MPIKVRYNGLEVDGNLIPLISGTVHYWRLDPEKWGLILDRVKELGFLVVETYIPWSIHETAPGEYDFGRTDPAKNLDRFLTLAEEKGLKVLVRPGPQINSELWDFGYPRRVLEQERLWARDSEGAPMVLMHQSQQFKVPSYASAELIAEFEPFLAHLAPILQKHLHPNGGIVAIQVDNEAGYFFRPGAFDLDYSQPSIQLYRHFLEMKYRQFKAISEAYGEKIKSFADVEPPKGPDSSSLSAFRRRLDWAEYKEYQLLWFLSKLAELFRSKGLHGVPYYHNFYGPRDTPFSVADIEKDAGIDFCGLDCYPHKEGAGWAVDQGRYLSATSNLPYIPEYGCGVWPFSIKTRDLEDHAATILAPIMGGARGINFYMLAERERWVGSPITTSGELRPELAEVFKRFNRFLSEQDWSKSAPQNQVLLMESREAQLIRAALLRPGHFGEMGFFPVEAWSRDLDPALFGKGLPALGQAAAFQDSLRAFLRETHYSYALADSSAPSEKVKKHAAVLLSCWGYLDEAFARRLRGYVEGGGTLLLGPHVPALNSRFEPLQAFEGLAIEDGKALSVGEGRLLYLQRFEAKAASGFLRKCKVMPELTLSDTSLDLALHKSGGRFILFVRNPHGEERACTVYREGKFVLKSLWSSGKFLGAVEERDVKLAPYEIKVWEVIPC